MDDQTDDALRAIAQEPDDLDGHTIEELADYLDTGRTPADPAIESSAARRHALAALERLRRLADDALHEASTDTTGTDAFISRLMSQIALDAHAGADFTFTTAGLDTTLVMTEGALRALIRAAGDDQDGFLVGRVRFAGSLSDPTTPLAIGVQVTVMHGIRIPEAAIGLRDAIAAAVRRHTDLTGFRIDITVQDLDASALDVSDQDGAA